MQKQQLEDFMLSLVENNQRVWAEWSRALQAGAGGSPDVGGLYRQGIDTMEALIRQTLQAESEWLDRWHEGVTAVPGAPDQLRQIFDGVRDGMQSLLEQRIQLWESLLEQARRAGSSAGADTPPPPKAQPTPKTPPPRQAKSTRKASPVKAKPATKRSSKSAARTKSAPASKDTKSSPGAAKKSAPPRTRAAKDGD